MILLRLRYRHMNILIQPIMNIKRDFIEKRIKIILWGVLSLTCADQLWARPIILLVDFHEQYWASIYCPLHFSFNKNYQKKPTNAPHTVRPPGTDSLRRCFLYSDMAHPPPYEPYYLVPAAPEYVYPAAYSSNDRNGINTLFISGLPDDVKAREIHNLFRRRLGFESCQLKYTGRGNQVTPLLYYLLFLCNSMKSLKWVFIFLRWWHLRHLWITNRRWLLCILWMWVVNLKLFLLLVLLCVNYLSFCSK